MHRLWNVYRRQYRMQWSSAGLRPWLPICSELSPRHPLTGPTLQLSRSIRAGVPDIAQLPDTTRREFIARSRRRGHGGWPFARHEPDSKGTATTAPTNVPLAGLGNLQVPKAMIQ